MSNITKSSATVAEAISSFIDNVGKDDSKIIEHRGGNLPVFGDTLYSYGTHFPLAKLMAGPEGERRGWFLLNGDRWRSGGWHAGSTDVHQKDVLSAVKQAGMYMTSMTVSFTALTSAGIDLDSVQPVDIRPDRYTWEQRTWDREGTPPDWQLDGSSAYSAFNGHPYETGTRCWQQRLSDQKFTYEESVHHLGESLFTARYSYEGRVQGQYVDESWKRVPSVWQTFSGRAYFLSAFDTQEGFGLYFLCQLPDWAHPLTVAEARLALEPPEVVEAHRAEGSPLVLRQGDVFAVQSDRVTRELPGPSKPSAYVLGTNHQATEVRTDGMGNTYARGILRHRPPHRQPDHHSVKLGDGKTWYLLVKNTVPMGRAWSIGGGVD